VHDGWISLADRGRKDVVLDGPTMALIDDQKPEEDDMAKGQMRSNREKKKPKANKAKTAPAASPFTSTAPRGGKPGQGGVPKKTS
jgi:hypothetical protein